MCVRVCMCCVVCVCVCGGDAAVFMCACMGVCIVCLCMRVCTGKQTTKKREHKDKTVTGKRWQVPNNIFEPTTSCL